MLTTRFRRSKRTHLVSDPQILIAIATILPIEARHSALLNTLSVGTLAPQSFEIALDVPSVLALVGGFLIVNRSSSLETPKGKESGC